MKALITTASSPTALFVVRRLKEMGYKVTAVDSHNRSFVSYSNAVHKRIVAPSLRYDPLGFAAAVIDELQQGQYSFYFPILECGFLMSHYKETIARYTKMITMPYQEITYAHNKNAMRDYARQAGVRMPQTTAPASLPDAFKILERLDAPALIKPRVGCNAHGQKIPRAKKGGPGVQPHR